MTALIVAVKGGYTQSVKEILKRNPNVNLTDKDGNTALMIASKEGHTEIVQDLLDAGTYVNIPDRVGACWSSSDVGGRRPQCPTTSLGSSCTRAFSPGLLVPQSPPFRGRPLCRGIARKSGCIIRTDLPQSVLVRCSFPCGLSVQSGDTVLIGAVRGGHVEIVRALLQKYADIDIRGQVRVAASGGLGV